MTPGSRCADGPSRRCAGASCAMLHRLAIRDFVIVDALEIELGAGFTVLTGETGAGKSILVDALQLALGGRGDAGVVREGAARAEISAEFDAPPALAPWLAEAGFEAEPTTTPAGCCCAGRSTRRARAAPGSTAAPPPPAQLREAGEALVDIHGQHAWQSLTRPPSVRALLDAYAQVDARAAGRRLGAPGATAARRSPQRARSRASSSASASASPGSSARSTSWRPATTNGRSSMPSTSAWPTPSR